MSNGSLPEPREDKVPATKPNVISLVFSPLHEAAATGDLEVLEKLLASGADRSAKETKHGNTALHEAAWRGYSKCVKALCELPKGPKEQLKETKSKDKGAITVHKTFGSLHSALLGIRNSGGFSPLHLAAQNGHNQSCREILLAGANPNVQNNYGDTSLHTACRYGHAGATRILLSAKCDPLRVNLNGDTALHIACAMGRRKLTRILLTSSSNPSDIKNAQGETARDIAVRKNLPEIIVLLDAPPPTIVAGDEHDGKQNDRDRSSSGSRNKVKTETKISEKNDSKIKTVKIENLNVDAANWSPYGCHYFPDPRSFPAPNLESLPKEPLKTGEQYFLDLAGNIHKGPVGVGNTCYCGPFFRHIEERISRNKKSIRKFVHKATEKLDHKVQALALKTDDQIEQITRSMLADRVRCEGQRIHLEEWLKRGDRARCTVAPHTTKHRKDQTNTNTLTRCRSLELLEDNAFPSKMDSSISALARSFDNVLSTSDNIHQVIIHHTADSESDHPASRSCSDRKNSTVLDNDNLEQLYSGKEKQNAISEKDHRSISEKDKNSLGERTDSDRSKNVRIKNDKIRYSVAERLEELLSKTNEIIQIERMARKKSKKGLPGINDAKSRNKTAGQLKVSSESTKSSGNCTYESEIVRQMQKSCLDVDRNYKHGQNDTSFIAEEMEKITSSLLGYNDDLDDVIVGEDGENDGPVSPEIGKEFGNPKERSIVMEHERDRQSVTVSESSYRSLYVPGSTGSKKSHSSSEDKRKQKHTFVEVEHLVSTENYENDDGDLSVVQTNSTADGGLCGFYQNSCFEDVPSSSSNTIKSDRTQKTQVEALHQILDSGCGDTEEQSELSEMANMKELNELKSRILNGTHWRSQVLRKSAQEMNEQTCRDENNVAISKFDAEINGIKGDDDDDDAKNISHMSLNETSTDDIFALPPRIKVNELVAKIQGPKSVQKGSDSHFDYNAINSESSNDEDDDDIMDGFNDKNLGKNVRLMEQKCETQESNSALYVSRNIEKNYSSYGYNGQLNNYQYYPQLYHKPTSINSFKKPEILLQQLQHQQRIIDTRFLIPKDAYFHELPNKNKLRPITDNLPENHLLLSQNESIPPVPISSQPQLQITTNSCNITPRSRTPLFSSLNQSTISHEGLGQATLIMPTTCMPQHTNGPTYYAYPQPTMMHHQPLPMIGNGRQQEIYQNSQPMRTDDNHRFNPTVPQPEKLLTNRKFNSTNGPNTIGQRNYEHIDSSTLSIPLLEINTTNQGGILLDHHAHAEQLSNNDSGYSTKIGGGSSMGPSPSLSGHTDPDLRTNSTAHSNTMVYDRYCGVSLGSLGASSLV